jgi:hypothetical protein
VGYLGTPMPGSRCYKKPLHPSPLTGLARSADEKDIGGGEPMRCKCGRVLEIPDEMESRTCLFCATAAKQGQPGIASPRSLLRHDSSREQGEKVGVEDIAAIVGLFLYAASIILVPLCTNHETPRELVRASWTSLQRFVTKRTDSQASSDSAAARPSRDTRQAARRGRAKSNLCWIPGEKASSETNNSDRNACPRLVSKKIRQARNRSLGSGRPAP